MFFLIFLMQLASDVANSYILFPLIVYVYNFFFFFQIFICRVCACRFSRRFCFDVSNGAQKTCLNTGILFVFVHVTMKHVYVWQTDWKNKTPIVFFIFFFFFNFGLPFFLLLLLLTIKSYSVLVGPLFYFPPLCEGVALTHTQKKVPNWLGNIHWPLVDLYLFFSLLSPSSSFLPRLQLTLCITVGLDTNVIYNWP